jgi:hypothetical protein
MQRLQPQQPPCAACSVNHQQPGRRPRALLAARGSAASAGRHTHLQAAAGPPCAALAPAPTCTAAAPAGRRRASTTTAAAAKAAAAGVAGVVGGSGAASFPALQAALAPVLPYVMAAAAACCLALVALVRVQGPQACWSTSELLLHAAAQRSRAARHGTAPPCCATPTLHPHRHSPHPSDDAGAWCAAHAAQRAQQLAARAAVAGLRCGAARKLVARHAAPDDARQP